MDSLIDNAIKFGQIGGNICIFLEISQKKFSFLFRTMDEESQRQIKKEYSTSFINRIRHTKWRAMDWDWRWYNVL